MMTISYPKQHLGFLSVKKKISKFKFTEVWISNPPDE